MGGGGGGGERGGGVGVEGMLSTINVDHSTQIGQSYENQLCVIAVVFTNHVVAHSAECTQLRRTNTARIHRLFK